MDTVEFVKQFPLRSFSKGEIVMCEGDVLDKLLSIQTGFIKVTSLDEAGVEHLLWIAGYGDIVPSERLFSSRNSLAFFYTALTDCTAHVINKREFLEHTRSNLSLMTDVATTMSAHYDDLLLRIDSIGQSSVHEKLLATLRYLAERFSANSVVDLHKLGLNLTHQDIADMIGSTRETTSLELQRLRQEGYISYNRAHFIIYLDKFIGLSIA
jgi:CRP-like cAMP-binding protein